MHSLTLRPTVLWSDDEHCLFVVVGILEIKIEVTYYYINGVQRISLIYR